MFLTVLERPRATLEDRYHHTVVRQRHCRKVVRQRHCRKVTFGLVGPTHIALAGMCATWLHSQGRQKTFRGGVAKESIHACKGVS